MANLNLSEIDQLGLYLLPYYLSFLVGFLYCEWLDRMDSNG